MKTIFKTAFIAVAMLCCIGMNAQEKPFILGLKAGANLSKLGGDPDGGAIPGFKVGGTLEIPLAWNSTFHILTGVDYSFQGGKDHVYKLEASYLQVPLHLGYRVGVWENELIFVFHGGPYAGYALDAKWKYVGDRNAFDDKIKPLGKLKKFDCGLGIGLGAEFGKMRLDIGGDFGMIDISDSDHTIKNMNGYITIGYRFKGY